MDPTQDDEEEQLKSVAAILDRTPDNEKKDKKKAKEQKKSSVKTKKEDSLLALPYYHGFMAREDLCQLVRQEGDFILRTTEVDGGGGLQLILTTMISQLPEGEVVVRADASQQLLRPKNLIVLRPDGQYSLDEKLLFPSAKDMIDYYLQNPMYSPRFGPIRLKKAIPLQHYEYAHSDVKLGKLLGTGAFGQVRQGTIQRGKKEYQVAVKTAQGEQQQQKEKMKEKVREMMSEVRIMRQLRHPNVVELYGIMILEQPIGILLELVDGGSLDQYLKKYAGLVDLNEKIRMCGGAAAGLNYIHSLKILHRDLAARNCLYGTAKQLKISDFGLSRMCDNINAEYKVKRQVKLPIKYLAPETINSLVFSMKTDVYSYGILCWEIFTDADSPFDKVTNQMAKQQITGGNFLTMPVSAPPNLRDFIHNRIFVLDSSKRVSSGDVLRFLEQIVTEQKMAEYQKKSLEVKTPDTATPTTTTPTTATPLGKKSAQPRKRSRTREVQKRDKERKKSSKK